MDPSVWQLYPLPGSQTRSSSHWAGLRLSTPASRRMMSRSCRRAARLASLTLVGQARAPRVTEVGVTGIRRDLFWI